MVVLAVSVSNLRNKESELHRFFSSLSFSFQFKEGDGKKGCAFLFKFLPRYQRGNDKWVR